MDVYLDDKETDVYDSGDARLSDRVLRPIFKKCQRDADTSNRSVHLYTSDGILVNVFIPYEDVDPYHDT